MSQSCLLLNNYIFLPGKKEILDINNYEGPKYGSAKCLPQRWHVEQWLIQFWNPLLMAVKVGHMQFPEFSTMLEKFAEKLCGHTASLSLQLLNVLIPSTFRPLCMMKLGNPYIFRFVYSWGWFSKKTIFDLPFMVPERSRKHLEKGALAN